MEWRQDGNRLVVKNRYETLWLEPWGTDALRVRDTQNPRMSGAAGAPVFYGIFYHSGAAISTAPAALRRGNGKKMKFFPPAS